MSASVLQNPDSWNLTFLIKNASNDHILFYEKAQNFIDATFGALPEIYGDWIVDSTLNDLASGHSTKISVSLTGKVEISDHEAQHGCGELQVFCEGLEVEFLPNTRIGMLAVTSNTCEVLLRKLSC
ncbi:hypothetical protein RND71_038569 [Anisodus tanguticus]|uniref:Uncharacterized protein n=1 Tax=Anisodus tanguticus TaxID=243964 RepID=A0AAE1R0R6_9SOLA|nr:hypothetical protein RND71_038569 [Anisodus tanguticus]